MTPFEPVTTSAIPQGERWVAQIKWDGIRLLTYCDGHRVALFNRHKKERTLHYPELTAIDTYCSARSVILDGEVIALKNGKPSFYQVMKRDGLRTEKTFSSIRHQVPIIYMVFDLLYFNDEWIIDRSFEERHSLLKDIITPCSTVQLVQNEEDPLALFEAVKELELEGIVIKDRRSRYVINGKDKRWQKRKVLRDLYAVVGGVTFNQNRVNALLLGLYDDEGQLRYIGHAGTGKLTEADWQWITQRVGGLKTKERPFVNRPDRQKDAVWLKPELTVKVSFLEWTEGKTMRQPSIQAIVQTDLEKCTFEQT